MELIPLVLDILVCMDQMNNTKADLQIPYPSLFGIYKKNPITYGDRNQSRDFTFVDNVVQANISGKVRTRL